MTFDDFKSNFTDVQMCNLFPDAFDLDQSGKCSHSFGMLSCCYIHAKTVWKYTLVIIRCAFQFLSFFSFILFLCVLTVHELGTTTYDGSWRRSTGGGSRNFPTFTNNPQYPIDLKKGGNNCLD